MVGFGTPVNGYGGILTTKVRFLLSSAEGPFFFLFITIVKHLLEHARIHHRHGDHRDADLPNRERTSQDLPDGGSSIGAGGWLATQTIWREGDEET